MVKEDLKIKAIKLRKEGKTYSEILKVIPVAKSTISDWLKKVGLSIPQKQVITEKRKAAQRKGADAQRNKRIIKQANLIENALKDIKSISKRELWLIGIALYWAEGAKEKDYRPISRVSFSNSDPRMIALFIKWIKECIKLKDEDLILSLYIHESHKDRIMEIQKLWSKHLNLPLDLFNNVYYKKNKINTKRKNTGDLYIGLLRVNISTSTDLNRKITGWIKGILENCGIV